MNIYTRGTRAVLDAGDTDDDNEAAIFFFFVFNFLHTRTVYSLRITIHVRGTCRTKAIRVHNYEQVGEFPRQFAKIL